MHCRISSGCMVAVSTACPSCEVSRGRCAVAEYVLLSETGSALTTFNKGDVNLNPKVIAHRSSATRGEMLVNSRAYRQFCHKARLYDAV